MPGKLTRTASQDSKGDREGRPYKDYEALAGLSRIFVGATLAVALWG